MRDDNRIRHNGPPGRILTEDEAIRCARTIAKIAPESAARKQGDHA